MTIVVDGNAILNEIQEEVTASFAAVAAARGVAPRVAIVQAAGDEGAAIYTRQLTRTFQRVGVQVEVHDLPADASISRARAVVQWLSEDPGVHGIQLQTPMPPQLPMAQLAAALDPGKDLDGVHPRNAGLLAQGMPDVVPATPLGGLEILLRHQVPLEGARAVIVGRSPTVGRPMALLLLARHATVTVCHTRTRDLSAVAQDAEILVAAAGKPGLISASMVRPGAAVIDFGVNFVDGRVVGDVDPHAVERAGLFTPVPGGTGPVTSAMLLRNTLALYRRAVGARE